MKESTKIVLATIGGIALYMFIKNKTFRKALLEALKDLTLEKEE